MSTDNKLAPRWRNPMADLEDLPESVRAAIRTMSGEAGGNRDDAYDVIEAELPRLSSRVKELDRENAALSAALDERLSICGQAVSRAERAESELAALKARIAEAPKGTVKWATPVSLAMDCESDAIPMYGRRVVLLDMGKEG